jgi:hypothetical protein
MVCVALQGPPGPLGANLKRSIIETAWRESEPEHCYSTRRTYVLSR